MSTAGAAGLSGLTANSFASLSLVPPLVLVCLRSGSATASVIARNKTFAVNVLSAEQEALARRFASPSRPRDQLCFAGVPHRTETTGAAILHSVACWFDCALAAMPRAGDHLIVIGEVLDYDADADREPLVFHAGRYRAVGEREAGRRMLVSPSLEFTRKEVNR